MSLTQPMKVLFVMRSTSHLRYHKSIIEAIKERGHFVNVAYDPRFSDEKSLMRAQKYCADNQCSLIEASVPRGPGYFILRHTRDLLSWRRYLTNKDVGHLKPFRQDWRGHLPFLDKVFLKFPGGEWMLQTKWFAGILSLFESLIPPNRRIRQDLVGLRPDVVIASPVNMRNSSIEVEYLKAAVVLNVPTAIQVFSWDNLTVRGLFHIVPDKLLCWNDVQAEEAVKYQGIEKGRIRIVGAVMFDTWFKSKLTAISREEFCKRYGLNPEYPIVAYLGSARNIAKDETATIRELRKTLDSSEKLQVKNTQIILRVHPANYKSYIDFTLHKTVEVPARGEFIESEDALKLFHDTLTHSVAVVQINTSGAIDAIVAGSPCISMLYPEFKEQQLETIHFKQLMQSGASDLPKNVEECVACIERLLSGYDDRKEARATFVSRFIRPRGMSMLAGEWVASELESLKK